MRSTRCRVAVQLGVLGLAVLFPSATLRGQEINGQGGDEIQRLREAAAREAAGDFPGAERILEAILEERPTAVSALLALERVYRVQGRVADVLAPVDRMLEFDPSSAIAHRLRLQTLSELGRLEELEAAAEAWIRATPGLETPYREIARIHAARGDHARAAAVLERGRSRVGRDDALALELGETYALLGDVERAVREWDRAVGPEARGFSLVRRHLGGLPDGGARLIPGLIDALTREPTALARRRAAVQLAIDAGLSESAEAIARGVVVELEPSEREAFLVEIARRADGARLPALAYWAYGELLGPAGAGESFLALRTRMAELALIVGDTAAAREQFAILERAHAVGSPERRRAAAMRIQLTASDGRVDEAMRALEAFREEYGDAQEVDGIAAAIAETLFRQGDVDRAERVLGRAGGPQSHLIRGRIALRHGDIAGARREFLSAAPGLEGAEATQVLSLLTLLGRLSPAGGAILGRSLARAMQGDVPGAIDLLVDDSRDLARGERAGLLDFAAGLADRSTLPAEAERIRRVIVAEHADAPEAPAALLALGRSLARRPASLDEARAFLERLVLDYPRSALAPQARRELDRLQRRVPHS
ncbi:MAG TPA: tetratricopeptide repeat protein [Longimicrobiales bacterium]